MDDAQPHGAKSGRHGRIYDRVVDAYALVDTGSPADVALRVVFKKSRDLGGRERAAVANQLFAMIRQKRRIDDLLARGLKAEKRRLQDLDPPIVHRIRLLVLMILQGASVEEAEAQDSYAAKRIPKLLSRIKNDRLPKPKREPIDALAIEVSLPTFIVEPIVERLGDTRARKIGEALQLRAPLTLRVNTHQASREEVQEKLQQEFGVTATPTKVAPHGLILPQGVDLQNSALMQQGTVEIQDEGSQLIALACGVTAEDRILDACAGAGGKSLAIAAQLGDRGSILALDPEGKKLGELRRRVKRAGFTTIQAEKGSLLDVADQREGQFDLVLIDAPCSGTGVLRRRPDTAWRLTPDAIDKYCSLQRHLLISAVRLLAPGGRLIYATCSLLPAENEDIATYAERECRQLAPLPLAKAWGEETSQTLGATHTARIDPGPDSAGPDGFFLASYRRLS